MQLQRSPILPCHHTTSLPSPSPLPPPYLPSPPALPHSHSQNRLQHIRLIRQRQKPRRREVVLDGRRIDAVRRGHVVVHLVVEVGADGVGVYHEGGLGEARGGWVGEGG